MNSQSTPSILLIGQVLVDVTLSGETTEPNKLRFGGVVHAARALWALGCQYGVAYVAPTYLEAQLTNFIIAHNAIEAKRIGTIDGSPSVVVIRKPKEYGPQQYEYLLRDESISVLDLHQLEEVLKSRAWTHVLLFPGGFDLEETLTILRHYDVQVDIDVNFQPTDWSSLSCLGRSVDTLILSTSSSTFLQHFHGNITHVIAEAALYANALLFKENRGGSRYYPLSPESRELHIPAHPRPISHSIGVGDCYDAIFAALRSSYTTHEALCYASCIATEYAATTYPERFRQNVMGWMRVPPDQVSILQGVSLSWEERPEQCIYIAAPDFDYVDRTPLEELKEALLYHNFFPRFPVREHGQARHESTATERSQLCKADLALLEECAILIAVLLYDDPGTLIEIGVAIGKGIPVIVYDPYRRAENLMLTESPKLVSSDLDTIISAVFEIIYRRSTE